MLVLEMHLDTVQLGQLGVADETNVRGEHFPNVGSPLFGPFLIAVVAVGLSRRVLAAGRMIIVVLLNL